MEHTLDALFARCEPVARETFDPLLEASQAAGPMIVEAKKISIHLERDAYGLSCRPATWSHSGSCRRGRELGDGVARVFDVLA